jgi:hypothetical protein
VTSRPGSRHHRDNRLVHEEAVILKVDATQWKREQRHRAGASFDEKRAAARNQRQALGPACGDVRQHHRLHKAAGRRRAGMGDKINLDKSGRWVLTIAERPHRYRATHRRTEASAPPATTARCHPHRGEQATDRPRTYRQQQPANRLVNRQLAVPL